MANPLKPLFHPKAVRRAVENATFPADLPERHALLRPWFDQSLSGELRRTDEVQLHGDFVHVIFGQILGYTTQGAAKEGRWNIRAEQNVAEYGRQAADGAIGWYRSGETPTVHAVMEFKGAMTDLDAVLADGRSAVKQGWDYANHSRTCRWIIVSNYDETRIYNKSRTFFDAHVFRLHELQDYERFCEFWALLACERLLPTEPGAEAPLDHLLSDSEQVEEDITKALYDAYRTVRAELFEHLRTIADDRDPLDVLRLTQKLLDRVLFIAFAEDRGLLPPKSLADALGGDKFSSKWARLCRLFTYVDKGSPTHGYPPYNGGLFAPDAELDSLQPSNEALERLHEIARYDFSEDVSVEVLGHIFEQSITDLEELRATARGEEAVGLSSRKRHGVFYTPSFVTRYVIERTLGKTLDERLKAAFAANPPAGRGAKQKIAAARAAWTAYRESLKTLRVLDPACGSGAFLVAAYDRLLAEYERVNRALEGIDGAGQRDIFNLTKTILNDNLFGVDINPESVEITRLSLWLKTAEADRQLTALDENVVIGDSIVDDPGISPHAFDWTRGVMVRSTESAATGDERSSWRDGFDIVVGNPPYVRQELLSSIKPHLQARYATWHGMADLFVYFFERGISSLRPGGRLGFIVANKWLKGGYAAPLREFLSTAAQVEEIIDFGHAPIFPDADAFPSVLTARRPDEADGVDPEAPVSVVRFPRESLGRVSIESYVAEHRFDLQQATFGSEPWALDPPDVRALMQRMERVGIALTDYAGTSPFRGVVTGCNDAFLIDEQTRASIVAEDPLSSEIIHRFLRGRDVSRWVATPGAEYLLFTRRGIEIDRYPGVRRHLDHFRAQLEPRPKGHRGPWRGRKSGNYAWYELQDPAEYWREFERPKIVYQVIQFHSAFALDRDGLSANDKVYFIPSADPWLLAVLNSPLMWWYNWRHLVHMKDEALNPSTVKLAEVPVPPPGTRHAEASDIVDAILDARVAERTTLDELIDWLATEFKVGKPGRALASPHQLTSDAFVAEVKKRRGKNAGRLTPGGLKALRQVHSETSAALASRAGELLALERRLSALVMDAFGLSDDELDLVRRTAPPRMPAGMPSTPVG